MSIAHYAIALLLGLLTVAAFAVLAFAIRNRAIAWRWLVPTFAVGALCGWYCSTVTYGLREDVTAVGFPIPSVLFVRQSNGINADYTGWMSLLGPPINFVLGFGMPCVALALIFLARGRGISGQEEPQ